MKRVIIVLSVVLVLIAGVSLGTSQICSAVTKGRESATLGAHQAVSYRTYSKTSSGKSQTLYTYVDGTYTRTNYKINAAIGTSGAYVSVYTYHTVVKGKTQNITLSNTVDAGKKVRLYYYNYYDVSDTDVILYQYMYY